MSFWTSPNVTPKFKDRFVVKIAGSLNIFVISVDKPTLTFDNKEYKMINHHFKYPGLPKWNTIKFSFVDMNGEGSDNVDAAKYLLELASNSGYENPTGQKSVSKQNSIDALGEVQIQQISTSQTGGKIKVTEEWKLINPIIKSISWGSLAYGDDGLVEYTLELDYDYAEHSAGHNIQGSG